MDPQYGAEYASLYNHHWWWRTREKIVVDTIRKYTSKLGNKSIRILDVGCGDGLSFDVFSSFGECFGLETDSNLISESNPHRTRISTNPLSDHYPDSSSYDLVTALDVIEHVEDDTSFARNCMRILKPGGRLILTVPAFMTLWDQHDVINHHWRRYTRGSIRRLFEDSGLIIECRYLFPSLFFPKFIVAKINRIRSKKMAQTALPGTIVSRIMIWLLSMEHRMNSLIRLPWGTSVMLVVDKPQNH